LLKPVDIHLEKGKLLSKDKNNFNTMKKKGKRSKNKKRIEQLCCD